MSDPTGTAGLRRSFWAEANRRLSRLRSMTHIVLVEHDMMAARNDPMAALFLHPGHRLPAFADWFARAAQEQLGGNWWQRFIERAYQSGGDAGSELTGGSPNFEPLPTIYRELAQREFDGVVAAMVQQVSRQAAGAAMSKRKPLQMYQSVLMVIRKTGASRLKAAVNTLTVQMHNAARLMHFQASGVTHVGIVPERLRVRVGRKRRAHDHAMHDRDMPTDFPPGARRLIRNDPERWNARWEELNSQYSGENARALLEQELAAEQAINKIRASRALPAECPWS